LSAFDEFFTASGDRDTKIEIGNEIEGATLWEGFLHHHKGSNSDEGFGNAKVAKLDDAASRVFVEETAFQVSGPVA
jgi:hypothetical protein